MIDSITRDKIIDATQIVDIIQDYVTLKKRGVNYLGLCPFHNEKTPSFTVSPSKGIFKCFGCGKGGNAVNFLMEHEQLTYPEALKYLAKKYGIEVEERELSEEEKKLGSERESLMIVTSFAAKQFADNLINTQEGREIGLSYLRERKFDENIINHFQLGYCLDERENFTNTALRNGYKLEFLEKSGLTIVKDNYRADRFSGRVMFPIFGLSGKVIGFGGRTLKYDNKTAKYINSPESIIYNKSRVLYGLFQAKNEIVKNNKCYLVEGYTDVLSLHLSGVKNVVASSGTSLTEEQVRLIKRFTENVTILFDGDTAGIKASIRSIDMFLKQGLNVRAVLFPEGEDPDSYAQKHNSSNLIKYINSSEEDFIKFKTKLLSEEVQNDPIKRASLITDIVRSIALIDNTIKQAVYVQECSENLNIEESVIYSEIRKIKRKNIEEEIKRNQIKNYSDSKKIIPSVPSFVDNVYYEVQEKEIIRLMLMYGNNSIGTYENNNQKISVAEYVINELRNDQLEIKNMVYQKIFNLVEKFVNEGLTINEKYFTNHSDSEICKISADLCSSNYSLSSIWTKHGNSLLPEDKQLKFILEDVVIKYKLKILQLAKSDIIKKIKEAQKNNDMESIEKNIKDLNTLIKIISKLSYLQERVILK